MEKVSFRVADTVYIWDQYPPSFLKNLKLVAVDELHYYSDLFGRFVFLRHLQMKRKS